MNSTDKGADIDGLIQLIEAQERKGGWSNQEIADELTARRGRDYSAQDVARARFPGQEGFLNFGDLANTVARGAAKAVVRLTEPKGLRARQDGAAGGSRARERRRLGR